MEIEIAQEKIKLLIERFVQERKGNDDPSNEFLSAVIERCYIENLNRGDVEFCLQERFGDSLGFTELFKEVWSDCEPLGSTAGNSVSPSTLASTPLLPDSIFSSLPNVLREGATVFEDKRQRDVFLLTALSTLSSALPMVSGQYSGDTVFPLLYVFVVAPAASGKSAMKYAGMMVETIHRNKKAISDEKRRAYETEKRAYERKMRSSKGDVGEPPIEPSHEVHFIPGNSSSASVISQLETNRGVGLIFETEADSLSNTFASEWGNFSDILRKNFQHEPIRSARKTSGEYREIEQSKFSISLTGTPGQVVKLIQSAEDGMFSRLSIYLYRSFSKWIDPSPNNHKVNLGDYFGALSQIVANVHNEYSARSVSFYLSNKQWELHNEFFSQKMDTMADIFGDESESVVKRLGLTCFRMAMALAAIDHFESGNKSDRIDCPDKLFSIALDISKVLLDHSLILLENLPKQGTAEFKPCDYRTKLFEALPKEFTRRDAIEIGHKANHSTRTIDGMLRDWLNGKLLVKAKRGVYLKSLPAS